MVEKIPSSQIPTFQQRIASKSLGELALSIKDRESLFKKKESTQLKTDLELLRARQKDLQRLFSKSDVNEIDTSINQRKSVVTRLKTDPNKEWELKAREIEIAVLKQAREREMYILRVNAKSLKELTASSNKREMILRAGMENSGVIAQAKYGLEVIRKRQAELFRHQSKSNPADVMASIKMRQRMLEDIKGTDEVSQLRSQKLQVEINILQDVIKEIQPKSLVKPIRSEVSGIPVKIEKKDLARSPESSKSKERIGKNGVIITQLVEDGVSIAGTKLRRGLDAQRIVSPKSSEQYVDNFKNLYSVELTAEEKNIPVTAAKEKLKQAKVKRMQILKLITVAYMPSNSEMKVFLQRDCGFKGDDYDKSALPALAYLRYLVENRVGNALEGDEVAVKALGNPVNLEQNLRKILDVIKKDVNNMTTNFQNELPKGIPIGATSRIEDRDTLHLGLLIRQFSENSKARKEHRIDELIERFA